MVLKDSSRLVWLEEQIGCEKTDFHVSGGGKKGKERDPGPKQIELKGWAEACRVKRV